MAQTLAKFIWEEEGYCTARLPTHVLHHFELIFLVWSQKRANCTVSKLVFFFFFFFFFESMLGRKLLQQLGKLGYVRRLPSTMNTEEVASMQSKNEMYWMKKGSWWPWSWSKPFNFLIYPFDGICVTAWLIFDTELWLLAEKRLFVACAETAPNSNATCIMYGSQWRNLLLFLSLFDDLEWVVGWKVWNVVAPLEVDT